MRWVWPRVSEKVRTTHDVIEVDRLSTEISCCEIARGLVDKSVAGHPCAKIVATQHVHNWNVFQIPEPWSGHLAESPILFLSSNPSISVTEAYPTGSSSSSDVASFFGTRFDGKWVNKQNQSLNADGSHGPVVRYWSCIRNRAAELLGREAVPGVDYTLSEIVHCKSINEGGVVSALKTCASRYLPRLLQFSGASVVVIVGEKALGYWNSLQLPSVPCVPQRDGTPRVMAFGRERVFLYLPHPAGPKKKRFVDWVGQEKLCEVRELLRVKRKGKSSPLLHTSPASPSGCDASRGHYL